MTLGSRSLFGKLALGLAVSLSAILPRASAEPATDEGAKVLPAASTSFSELQRIVGALPEGDESPARLIEEWLAGRDLSELSIEEVRWCLFNSLPNEQDRRAFTVTWTGLLKAPRTGSYVFSLSPINVNGSGRDAVRQTISVTVAGVESLNTSQGVPADAPPSSSEGKEKAAPRRIVKSPATPWHWKGAPIKLQADRAVPVQVVLEYEGSAGDESSPPSAILCWEGPSLKRQPVGESFFSDAEGAPGGLRAEYKWHDSRGQQSVTQASSTIDYAWTSAARVAPPRPELVERLVDRLWQLATDSAYLEKCTAGKAEHIYFRDYASTEYLSTGRRQEFLELLVSRPELLATADEKAVLRLYRKLRFGAEEAAIDMLGASLQSHADISPVMAVDFFERNRRVYWELGACLARQLPGHLNLLRDGSLLMDDGRCALPVAYVLNYGYLTSTRESSPPFDAGESPETPQATPFGEWMQLLTEMCDEPATEGAGVNWRIARAQVTEALAGLPPRENYFAGMKWLHDARPLVTNEAEFIRVHAEIVARLLAMNQQESAKAHLDELAGAIPDNTLRQWKEQASSIDKHYHDQNATHRQSARARYASHILRRRDQAKKQNDDLQVSRYDRLLNRLAPEDDQ
jgi:hypothetical protein